MPTDHSDLARATQAVAASRLYKRGILLRLTAHASSPLASTSYAPTVPPACPFAWTNIVDPITVAAASVIPHFEARFPLFQRHHRRPLSFVLQKTFLVRLPVRKGRCLSDRGNRVRGVKRDCTSQEEGSAKGQRRRSQSRARKALRVIPAPPARLRPGFSERTGS